MITLVKTCDACPEQYDAYQDGRLVGYLRLRHGCFTVDCPDVNGKEVYRAAPKGDGIFEYDERDYYLRFAVKAIEDWIMGGYERPAAPDVSYQIDG